MSRLAWWRALRAPVWWAGAWWGVAHSPALRAKMVLWQSAHNPFHRFFCAPPSFQDCFFFLPSSMWLPSNLAKMLGGALAIIVAAEVVRPHLAARRSRRDGGVALVALWGAAACVGWLQVRGPNIRLLPVFAGATLLLWALLVFNLGVRMVDRVMRRPAVGRVLDWTFPVSDVLCFARNSQRLGSRAARWRRLPAAALIVLFGAGAWSQFQLSRAGSRAERLPATLYDPRQVAADAQGAWITEAISRYDAGLWRYETGTGDTRSVLRAADLDTIVVQDGRLYLYDGFDRAMVCWDARTQAIAWRVPMPAPSGHVKVLAAPGRLVAVGEAGFVSVMDRQGKRVAARSFDHSIWHPQMLTGGRLAFVAPEPAALVVTDPTLAPAETIPLRAANGAFAVPPRTAGSEIPVVTGLASLEGTDILCVATLWGEILRYDLKAHAWLSSWWTAMGLTAIAADGPRGCLVVYHASRGTIEVLEAATGTRRALAHADAFGTTLSLDPQQPAAYLSAHGPGFTSLPKPGAVYRVWYGAPAGVSDAS